MKFISMLSAVAMGLAFVGGAIAAEKKYKEGGCCDKAAKKGEACKHPCCVEADKAGKVCEKCNK